MKKILLVVAVLTGTSSLQADIIYSSFGTGSDPLYITGSGAFVTSGGTDYSTAFEFTATSNLYLTQIDFVATLNSGDNSISATLYADDGLAIDNSTAAPGTLLYTTGTLTNQLDGLGNPVEIQAPVSGGPLLVAGDSYWLSLDGDTSSSITWNYNGDYTGGQATTFDGTNWQVPSGRVLGAFELDGTSVPEPASIFLLFPGMAGLAALHRRRRRQ
jgi:hypothetical protein